MYRLLFLPVCFLLLHCQPAESPYNFNERKVPDYELPEGLRMNDGSQVSTTSQWEARREELLALFRTEVYGEVPGELDSLVVELMEREENALGGMAIRKQYLLHAWRKGLEARMELLIYLPKSAAGPAPLFLGMNFSGNQTVHPDPAIRLTESWVRYDPSIGIDSTEATEASRGAWVSRWPVETILARGYGLATIYYGDVVPDWGSGYGRAAYPLFYEPGQQQPDSTEWGAISAWAWGLQRVMDVLSTDSEIDPTRIAVLGHSRLGKTALWAGAQDPRFALVISNNSGCGGAALSRRRFGETVMEINAVFPHWFNDRFPLYNDREDELPIDQHLLLALIAPRPLYVASAEEDQWADPRGEFLSAYHASEVYELYGLPAIETDKSPKVDQPMQEGVVGYHLRSGKHELTDYDWAQYLDVADRWMR
jgi:hypothetical protein